MRSFNVKSTCHRYAAQTSWYILINVQVIKLIRLSFHRILHSYILVSKSPHKHFQVYFHTMSIRKISIFNKDLKNLTTVCKEMFSMQCEKAAQKFLQILNEQNLFQMQKRLIFEQNFSVYFKEVLLEKTFRVSGEVFLHSMLSKS